MLIKDFNIEQYLEVQNELLFYFGKESYTSELELQDDFNKFKGTGFYTLVMSQLGLEEVNIEGRFWKLCKGCGKPFLTNDRRSVSITCYREVYRRYSVKGKRFFNEDYQCRMEYKRKVANERNQSL